MVLQGHVRWPPAGLLSAVVSCSRRGSCNYFAKNVREIALSGVGNWQMRTEHKCRRRRRSGCYASTGRGGWTWRKTTRHQRRSCR